MAHALLSPSSATRWLACTPSARLESQFPDTTSEAAAEGTAAHELGEVLLRKSLGLACDEDVTEAIESDKIGKYYSSEMYNYADDYAVFVLERFYEAKSRTPDAELKIEARLDMTSYVPEGFGTGDAVIIADGVMDVVDLKYGKGVAVYAENNKQMMLYALGALHGFDFMYDIRTVRMTIYQPRLDNISTWEISVEALLLWADSELKHRAKMAFDGEGDYASGEHCRFCRASATCRARADKNLEIAKYEFRSEALLTDSEITDILSRADEIKKWLTQIHDHAHSQAVNHGRQWEGYKLVEGRSNRAYSNIEKVVSALLEQGYSEDDFYSKDILGVTAMEKVLTKKGFQEILGGLIIKPPGKPTLVPDSDKRTEWSSTASAVKDFSETI